MSCRLEEVTQQIDILKEELNKLWGKNGSTNEEILEISEKIDNLLNEYDRLLQSDSKVS